MVLSEAVMGSGRLPPAPPSLNDLIGAQEERCWDGDTERLGRSRGALNRLVDFWIGGTLPMWSCLRASTMRHPSLRGVGQRLRLRGQTGTRQLPRCRAHR
jgi:hypothetical protein